MRFFLKAYFLDNFQDFLSSENKTLSNFLLLRNLYGEVIKHLEEILIYGLEAVVLEVGLITLCGVLAFHLLNYVLFLQRKRNSKD